MKHFFEMKNFFWFMSCLAIAVAIPLFISKADWAMVALAVCLLCISANSYLSVE